MPMTVSMRLFPASSQVRMGAKPPVDPPPAVSIPPAWLDKIKPLVPVGSKALGRVSTLYFHSGDSVGYLNKLSSPLGAPQLEVAIIGKLPDRRFHKYTLAEKEGSYELMFVHDGLSTARKPKPLAGSALSRSVEKFNAVFSEAIQGDDNHYNAVVFTYQ